MSSLSPLFSRINRPSSHSHCKAFTQKSINTVIYLLKRTRASLAPGECWGGPGAAEGGSRPGAGERHTELCVAEERHTGQPVPFPFSSLSPPPSLPLCSLPSLPLVPAPGCRSSAAALPTCGSHAIRVPGERGPGGSPRSPAPSPHPLSPIPISAAPLTLPFPAPAVLRPAGHRVPPRQPQLHPRWQLPAQPRGQQDLPVRPQEVRAARGGRAWRCQRGSFGGNKALRAFWSPIHGAGQDARPAKISWKSSALALKGRRLPSGILVTLLCGYTRVGNSRGITQRRIQRREKKKEK